MNITVYLGANEGKDPALKQAVQELGRWIGESGNALVYGGSRCGLMGEIAESTRRGRSDRRGTGVFCAGRAAARGADGADRDKGYD